MVFVHGGDDVWGGGAFFDQRPAGEAGGGANTQPLEKIGPGIIFVAKVVDVDRAHAILNKFVVECEPFALQIFGVAVPADHVVGVIGDVHNGLDVGQFTSRFAVNLQSNLDAIIGTVLGDFVE